VPRYKVTWITQQEVSAIIEAGSAEDAIAKSDDSDPAGWAISDPYYAPGSDEAEEVDEDGEPI